jgi:hypothetical protein
MAAVDRRSVLRWIAGAPLAIGFGVTRAEARAAHQHAAGAVAAAAAGESYAPTFFTPHEWRTVTLLADMILPADERSGSASDAGVPEFIDFLMTDPVTEDRPLERRQTAMRGGLAWIDAECRERFGQPFADCGEAQRVELLDGVATSTGDEDEEDDRDPRDLRIPEPRHGRAFFNSFRDLVASGFWSSRMGVEDLDYRGNDTVEWTGPPPEVLRKLGLE